MEAGFYGVYLCYKKMFCIDGLKRLHTKKGAFKKMALMFIPRL